MRQDTAKSGLFLLLAEIFLGRVVFVQARLQCVALVENTFAEMLAGAWSATAFATVRAFKSRIAGPHIVHNRVDEDD